MTRPSHGPDLGERMRRVEGDLYEIRRRQDVATPRLRELRDASLTTAVDGDVPVYRTATGRWENEQMGGGGGSTFPCELNAYDLGLIASGSGLLFDCYPVLQGYIDDNLFEDEELSLLLCFPPQTGQGYYHNNYYFSQPLDLPDNCEFRTNPSLEGNGVALCTNSEDGLIGSGFYLSLHGLNMFGSIDEDGNPLYNGIDGTLVSGISDLWMERCQLFSADIGVEVDFRLHVDRCGFYGVETAIHDSGLSIVQIANSEFINCGQVLVNERAYVLHVTNCSILNQAFDLGPIIEVAGFSDLGTETRAIHILGNNFNNPNDNGLPTSVKVVSAITGTVDVSNNTIRIFNNDPAGPALDVDANYGTVQCNRISTTSSDTTYNAIKVAGDHTRVQGNVVKNYGYGVEVVSGATDTAVVDNTLSGITGTVTDAGTGTTDSGNLP